MTEYSPNKWVVIKIETGNGPIFKVFGTWYGGYTTGDSWKLNSGISSVESDGDYILFHGFSGSIYRVHKDAYGASAWSSGVLVDMIKSSDGVEILDEDTDWFNLGET